ncbi:signal recognition particle-docking protein FtsY [archaeon]|nr:signal recognition particle-docking protein FtsY [archaeon]MBT4241757.1 signal recognition particle-docking protein FtsY [archaeon]MBT4418305.1 signal recognition particle-docking protein FtsY [archaeon]
MKDVKEEIIAEETEIPEKLPDEKKSFLSKFKTSFAYKITEEEFNEIFDDLEMLLLESNVALDVVDDIRKKLSEKLIGKQIKRNNLEAEIQNELKQTLNEILIEPDNPLDAIKLKKEKPFTILFFGINGTGKTTSISKLTHFLKKAGFSVALAAGDTFRAASIEQLTQHANKLDVPIIKHDYNADPSAVGYDAIQYAKKHQIDVVLIDTAGRMHTKQNLLAEMEKIVRVTKPDLKIFVAESIAGNDATEQAKAFHELIEIDGSILTKADIDEKGGTIISVSHTTNKPIFYLGTGQNYEDIELFNKQRFIENLGL